MSGQRQAVTAATPRTPLVFKDQRSWNMAHHFCGKDGFYDEGENPCPECEKLKGMSARVTATRRRLRMEIEEAGLGRVAGDLEAMMMPSIRINATVAAEGVLKPGSSKLGGIPDLPEGGAWPDCNGLPMSLLAQLRLQDVAPLDLDKRLPKSGMLYFFYNAREQRWGYDPKDRGHWKVIYYNGDLARLQPAARLDELPEHTCFRECGVAFTNELTLPSWQSRDVERMNLSEKERDVLIQLLDGPGGEWWVIHRLLGHPAEIQGDMKLACQLASHWIYVGNSEGYADPRGASLEAGADDWQLLLQIDSDEDGLGTMWGDRGRVYFWIRQQDLKEHDFGNTWLKLQCY